MNAFGSKSYSSIESSNEQIKRIAKQIINEVKKIESEKEQIQNFEKII